jgi:hypothetical protein
MVLAKSLADQLAASIDPYRYMESLGWFAFEWQVEVLNPGIHRLILLCARQSGKSTVIAAKVVHRAKYFPGSLILLFAPTEDQSVELMSKISVFMKMDPEIVLVRDSSETKKLLNGSRIKAFTSSPGSARGYSDPDIIVIDESSRVADELYLTIRPMMAGGKTDLLLLSTPAGKEGFFCNTWERPSDTWVKVYVRAQDILHEVLPNEYPEFDSEQWIEDQRKRGVKAYISPRHTREFLLEEFKEMNRNEFFFRQEYYCEFLNQLGAIFNMDDVDAAFSAGIGEKTFDYDIHLDTVKIDSFWRR